MRIRAHVSLLSISLLSRQLAAVRLGTDTVKANLSSLTKTLTEWKSGGPAETLSHVLNEDVMRQTHRHVLSALREANLQTVFEEIGVPGFIATVDGVLQHMGDSLVTSPSTVDHLNELKTDLMQVSSEPYMQNMGRDLASEAKTEARKMSSRNEWSRADMNPYFRFESGPLCVGSVSYLGGWGIRFCPLTMWISYPRKWADLYWPSLKIVFPPYETQANGVYKAEFAVFSELDIQLMADKGPLKLFSHDETKQRWCGYTINIWLGTASAVRAGTYMMEWVAGMIGTEKGKYVFPFGETLPFTDVYAYQTFRQDLTRDFPPKIANTSTYGGFAALTGATVNRGEETHKYLFYLYFDKKMEFEGLSFIDLFWKN